MNMYKSLLIVSACLVSHFHVSAQSHDPAGYYINLKNDTVSGRFVHLRESGLSPSEVSFQTAGSAELINLSPSNCKKFSIPNLGDYVSYQGKRLTNPTDYNAGNTDSTSTFGEISAFLLVLFNNGHYHLYEFADSKRSNFYISAGEGPLQELYYKEYIQNGTVIESQEFRRQLSVYFQAIMQENPEAMGLIQKTAYNSSGLTALFNKMVSGNKVIATKKKYPVQIFAGFGASSNSLSVTVSNGFTHPDDESATYPSQVSPLFEIGVSIFSQQNYGRLFLVLRADYYSFKHSHEFDDNVSFHTTTTFSSDVLSFPIGIGYQIVKTPHFNLDLSAGPNLSFLINNSEVKVTNSVIRKESDNPNAFGMSFFGEASFVLYNRVSFFAGYYTPYSITNAGDYNAKQSSFRYGVRVRII